MTPSCIHTPRRGDAQSSAMRQIGILGGGTAEDMRGVEQRLLAALAPLGWTEGQSLQLRRAYADRQLQRLPALAAELARSGVDVMITGASATTLAAARATRTVPIVFISVHFPVEQGFVQSLARPGGNLTGPLLYPSLETTIKRLEFLRAFAPDARRLAWIWPDDLFDPERIDGSRHDTRPPLLQAARALEFEPRLHVVPAGQPATVVFDEVLAARSQVISAAVYGAAAPVANFALEHRLPSGYPMRYFTAAGGLFSYGPTQAEAGAAVSLSARYVDRILRGAKPADLAIEVPSRYELLVNRRTLQVLGLNLPLTMQARLDEIIE